MIICNPDRFSREQSYAEGISHCTQWLQDNRLPVPVFLNRSNSFSNYGLYLRNPARVLVNVPRTCFPVREPIRRWSFTGYKADLTAAGVVAHEIGHHVNAVRGWRELQVRVVEEIYDEPPVSSYEPNKSEIIAEAFKVFILNPDLLRVGRPRRWEFITETVGVRPPHAIPWREILQWAHPKLIRAAENWIAKGNHDSRRASAPGL